MRDRYKLSIYCPYCARYTSLTAATTEGDGMVIPLAWAPYEVLTWWKGICNSCQQPVLVLNQGQTVLPEPRPSPTDEHIPETMHADLDEPKRSVSVQAYRACAVMARRAMQSACIDKGAQKDKLVDQSHELADSGVITRDLKEWGDVVRWVGNDAAHPNGDAVTKDDAEAILNLAEQFLHVVYVTPAIAQEQRAKRGK